MVASGLCEEKVFVLVAGKRHLFGSAVVEAGCDVVGVSKRMLELALESLDLATEVAPVSGEPEPSDPAPAALP